MGHMRKTATRAKWPSVAVLAALLAATAVGWYWVWGIFFLYWSIYGIVTGQAFVVQMVYREENPNIFWFINVSWVVLAVITILYDAAPYIHPEFAETWLGVTIG